MTTRHRPLVCLAPFALVLLALLAGCRGAAEAGPAAAPATGIDPTTAPEAAAPSTDRTMPPMDTDTPPGTTTETITLGAGCFWCIEAVLERIEGVASVDSGYMGGAVANPTYEQICTGTTGHAEVVRVVFDPKRLPLANLLDWFFRAHDPTTLNRQGNDEGTQYRSAIFFGTDTQRKAAEAAKLRAQALYGGRIVTEITPASEFHRAEEYHQEYFANNPNQPYCRALIPPKLKKLGLDQLLRAKDNPGSADKVK